ncbi:Lrp/AsnC family transcriptional regulator [Planosporangium mesophilum]|uniref:Transcriptional regulator n=1 Tax=Planosporangium mesophilum TaxID=689768 RepID=A0A8J3TAJ5_9ACTN|nr:Lrp/AsnC family transcriptional regulator [Planosporangium mesophilum]NJC83267.1 Lrp/AsnC family transcriptional regulator [Planosporangium mesophilum]GII21642.1 transcriptional regulator [Planosporangium mesophilum]
MHGSEYLVSGFLGATFAASGDAGSGVRLSELDRSLIRLLQLDGRQSFAAISRELRVPEKTIRRRVNELLESRVIQITTVADPAVLGYKVAAMVGVRVDGRRGIKPLVESMATLPSVDYAVITTGRYDALVEVLCRDTAELLTVVDESIVRAPGVRSAEVFPYLQLHYQEPAWDVGQHKGEHGQAEEREPLDATDRRIVAELSTDGRLPFGLVGERLGISESQVRKRVTRMLQEKTIRISAIANPRSLGFNMQAWVGIRCAPGHSITDLAQTLTKLPSIKYVVACAGRFDVFAEAVCRDSLDLMRLVDSEIRTLTGVAGTEVLLCLELYYRAVQPLAPDDRA